MRGSLQILNKSALALAALMLAGCTVVVEDGPRPVPIDPGPRVCPGIYAPVCAAGRGERQTFPNACEADRAGYRVLRRGECRGDVAGGPRPPQVCTREYRPVCARRGGNVRTFGNSCEAESSGYRIISRGTC